MASAERQSPQIRDSQTKGGPLGLTGGFFGGALQHADLVAQSLRLLTGTDMRVA
jgi:hypothetical protein